MKETIASLEVKLRELTSSQLQVFAQIEALQLEIIDLKKRAGIEPNALPTHQTCVI